MLEIKNVSKKYLNEKNFILDEISLCFKEKELSVIIGESGSGKSTIMNILGGLDLDYSGDIFYKENKILRNNVDEYRRNNVGFIFQSFNLLPHLTAFENVELSLKIKGNYSKKKVENVFEKLKILDLKNKNINELSGGQKQRVAIARAIVNDPDIILADEPTGSLDPENTKVIMDILNDLKNEGKIVIVVTHSKEVSEYADKVIEVKNSKTRVIKERTNDKKLFSLKEKENTKNNVFSVFEISVKNILRNKKRNILIVLATSVGIFCISFMMFLNSGIKKYINDEINVNYNPKELEVNKSNDPLEESLFTKSDIYKISNIRHVRKVNTIKSISSSSSIDINNKKVDIVSLTSFYNINKSKLKMGNKSGLLISEKMAKEIDKNQKNILNKKVTLYIIENSKPCILKKEIKITGIIKEENELLDNMNYAYIPNIILNKMYTQEKVELKTSLLNVYIDNKDNMNYVKKELKNKGYYYQATTKIINQIYKYVDIVSLILIGISGISLVVSSIMIYIIMHINVVERTKEIGILKSLGMTKNEIKKIFLYESSLIGFLSGLFGIIISSIISIICNSFLVSHYKSTFITIEFKYIILSIIISILISTRAGLKPSKKASKLDPINSLRYE